ncbi:hypothetical protein [Pseudomonas putida]|uniref:hypothetical protein n=1 Tax=Pseudomonas putida TaxID=303 RepID=UPI00300F0988
MPMLAGMQAKKNRLEKGGFFLSDRTEYPSLRGFTENIHVVSEGIEVPIRCWKTGPPTRRPRYMKRLLDALSRAWKLVRILIVLKTVRDFMRDHFDDAR